jgi:hypothetical protein
MSDSGPSDRSRGTGKSQPEQWQHYREYAAQIQDLADREPAGQLRDRLTRLADEYRRRADDLTDPTDQETHIGKPWSSMDLADLKTAVRMRTPPQDLARFLRRSVDEVERKIAELERLQAL